MVDSLQKLGFIVVADHEAKTIGVRHPGDTPRVVPAWQADLWIANSGTTVRFLAALVSTSAGQYRLDGVARMRERPIDDLLTALHMVGVNAQSEYGTGCPPVLIRSTGWKGNTLAVRGDVSSQFLSGLLMAAVGGAPHQQPMQVRVDGPLVSVPYVAMTVRMMQAWGINITWEDNTFTVVPEWATPPATYAVEPDASTASYFFALAAILGGRVTVLGLSMDSLQGDVRFVQVLEQMGCRVESCDAGITLHGRPLRGIAVDMNDISDTVMTLGAVACFATGPTTIRNVGHIRHKETDRLTALATELRKVGAGVEETTDGLTITPQPLQGATLATYNDHRMAMSLALLGVKIPGIIIENPGCVAKTYPDFWTDLDALRTE
jgi:3-phosphoshikimate 1-carboxyvinyltransferase